MRATAERGGFRGPSPCLSSMARTIGVALCAAPSPHLAECGKLPAMPIQIRPFSDPDTAEVLAIYAHGVATGNATGYTNGNATFESHPGTWAARKHQLNGGQSCALSLRSTQSRFKWCATAKLLKSASLRPGCDQAVALIQPPPKTREPSGSAS